VGQTAEELARLDQQSCPICGITFFEFRNQGRLGCPHDYVCFQKELEPLLMNIHGETVHVGKRPRRSQGNTDRQTELIRMRREMKEAVEQEDYGQRRNCATRYAPGQENQRETRRARRRCGQWLRLRSRIGYRHRRIRLAEPGRFRSFATTDHDQTPSEDARRKISPSATVGLMYVNVGNLRTVDRQFLVERQLISRNWPMQT
jgi:hypothetical protein